MPISDFTPTTVDVANFLRARTRDQYGNEVGDFTVATTPTGDQASALINEAVDEVAEMLSADLPVDIIPGAKRLATMLAAANIEMSYYPEQAAANNSMYDKLMVRVNALQTRLSEDLGVESEEETFTEDSGLIFGSFPPSQQWGRRRW